MAHHQVPAPALRAYSDPSIFRNDRVRKATANVQNSNHQFDQVLRTLLRRELKLGPGCSAKTFYSSVQVEQFLVVVMSINENIARQLLSFVLFHSSDRGEACDEARGKQK